MLHFYQESSEDPYNKCDMSQYIIVIIMALLNAFKQYSNSTSILFIYTVVNKVCQK